MSEIKVTDGKAYCEKCGKEVHVKEMKGEASTVQYRHVLVDASGHVVAERPTEAEPWRMPT
jgi:hypothetical protein